MTSIIYLDQPTFSRIFGDLHPTARFMDTALKQRNFILFAPGGDKVQFIQGERPKPESVPEPEVDWDLYNESANFD